MEKKLAKTIQQAQRGDSAAFASLVRQFERPVRAFVAARCLPGIEVDEIAQRVFVVAHKKLSQFDASTNFVAWLCSIANFEAVAEATRIKRQADYHTRYIPHALAQELERRGDAAGELHEQRLQFLQECLDEMEANSRRLVDWRYRDELPLSEIASRSSRTVGAIKKHLFLLRRQLRMCIEKKLAIEGSS